jgi:DUF4097 and DUF4098 domain-containing protein YvlB
MKNSKYFILLIAFVLSFTSLNCLSKRYDKKETAEFRINLNGKSKISLENVNGTIELEKGDSAEGLYIKADMIGYVKKKDLDKPLEDLSVKIDTSGNVIIVTGEYESKHSFFNFNNKSSKINFIIKVPAGLPIEIDNVNGDFDARNISNDFKLTLVNGDIILENTSGKNEIDVTNGKVKGNLDSTKGLSIEAINGSINLTIPKTYNGKLSADVVNGKINYENLELTNVSDEKKSLRAYIVNKDKEIKCDLVNGKITFTGK